MVSLRRKKAAAAAAAIEEEARVHIEHVEVLDPIQKLRQIQKELQKDQVECEDDTDEEYGNG